MRGAWRSTWRSAWPGPRRRAAIAIWIAVLALHGSLWAPLPGAAPGPGRLGEAPRLVQVRQLRLPAAPPVVERPVVAVHRPSLPTAPPPVAAAPEASPEPPPPGAAPLPRYATHLAPPALLRYRLRRGSAEGLAELRWRPRPDGGYEITLRSQAPGIPALEWTSTGRHDGSGLAPTEHSEWRRGRARRGVAFDAAAGRIRYGGALAETPWQAGAQDRVSWLIQLAAIVDADPARAEVLQFVAGVAGRAEVWRWLRVDDDDGSGDEGVHLRRAALRAWDPQIDVWLAPRRHHLPQRLRWSQPGRVTEWTLIDDAGAPGH
ncbi:MAG: hypothetical protein KGN16_06505 [Burkholderiales bacterium]|nr:hypothetical protein [Burkholderiales bacterium]